ncbi:MAG: hypothetical protein QGH20_11540 [Candidatus Latescibacteria bacterium]|nr:hypothetical protein [Candidatus Latescibacterota bacterium]
MLRWVLRLLAVAVTAGVGAALWLSRKEQARAQFMDQAKNAVKKAVEKAHETHSEAPPEDSSEQSPTNPGSPGQPDDPGFDAALWDELASVIDETPEILQTDLYSQYPPSRRAVLRSTVKAADEAGLLVRTKAGRTYTLSLLS